MLKDKKLTICKLQQIYIGPIDMLMAIKKSIGVSLYSFVLFVNNNKLGVSLRGNKLEVRK